jgi:6-pyruvoyltetrahydropterin/6-carboxytetrahydropterin synthase
MMRVTRRYQFSASHRLHAEQLSAEENRQVYGKCDNPHGHGHNYEIEVSARGPVDPRSGRALDRQALDRLVAEHVLRAFDFAYLNEQAAFRSLVPTTENLGNEIFHRLKTNWPSFFAGEWPRLEKVRVLETSRNMFEISETNGQV